jgi:hypothetical protein
VLVLSDPFDLTVTITITMLSIVVSIGIQKRNGK